MKHTAGIDVGSTYTKVVLHDGARTVGSTTMKTGFRLAEVARRAYDAVLAESGVREADVEYVIATGYGRFQVPFADVQITDLTAMARGACHLFPLRRSFSTRPIRIRRWCSRTESTRTRGAR